MTTRIRHGSQPPASAGGSNPTRSWLGRLRDRLLPRLPDFYGFLVEQCGVADRGCGQLLELLESGDPARGDAVREIEREGDALKARNLEALHHSFATPMDREDFYQAVEAMDDIVNYARATVRELELFGLAPDRFMVEMARGIRTGTEALLRSCLALEHEPEEADRHARAAIRSERLVEGVYREALAELFDPERLGAGLGEGGDGQAVMTRVSEVFRRREVYRHLSNAADRLVRAGEVLGDVIAKAT